MKPKVSIVVPIYNGGKYLRPCIESIINQTLKEIEIFLVDDGSTDYSLSICKEFERKDSRITVIHIENQGGNIAFNLAREKCTGEYLYLMDDDDVLISDALETLYNEGINGNYEVVKGLSITKKDNTMSPNLYNNWYESKEINWRLLSEEDRLLFFNAMPESWSHLYKLDWLNENNIYPSNHYFYDTDFIFKVKAKSTKYKVIPKFVYIWNVHRSLSHNSFMPFEVINCFNDLENFLKKNEINELSNELFYEKIRVYSWNYKRVKEKNEFLSMIEENIRDIIIGENK